MGAKYDAQRRGGSLGVFPVSTARPLIRTAVEGEFQAHKPKERIHFQLQRLSWWVKFRI